MNIQLRNALTSSIFLKTVSLILGFLFWNIISDSFISTMWVKVPVCFYNSETKKLQAPETIQIELKGKRTLLKHLPRETIALHIDAQKLPLGTHQFEITRDHFFLPSSILVSEIIPQTVFITCSEGEQS